MADRLQQERDAFEARLREEGFHARDLYRKDDGEYLSVGVAGAWMGWMLRARTAGVTVDSQEVKR